MGFLFKGGYMGFHVSLGECKPVPAEYSCPSGPQGSVVKP